MPVFWIDDGHPCELLLRHAVGDRAQRFIRIGEAGATHGISCNRKPSYSFLRASIGEIDAARRAGIAAAKNADIASVAAATAKANGSQLETP